MEKDLMASPQNTRERPAGEAAPQTERLRKPRYGREIPLWLRLLGCFGIEGKSYRMNWGEICFGWDLAIGYSVYHESANINIAPLLFSLHLKVPMVIKQRRGTEDWMARFGIWYCFRTFQFCWRDKCRVFYLPWDWSHVRHTYLWPDGQVHHHAGQRDWEAPKETKSAHPYTYVLKSGVVQERVATINGEEREWRWRWFRRLPWPRKIRRSINIDFNDEVGERSGSWKGGCLGCGYDWKMGESQVGALRRMQRERKFT
jgi:hypothetical protein